MRSALNTTERAILARLAASPSAAKDLAVERSSTQVYGALRALTGAGLVEVRYPPNGGGKLYRITERGRKELGDGT